MVVKLSSVRPRNKSEIHVDMNYVVDHQSSTDWCEPISVVTSLAKARVRRLYKDAPD